MVILVVYKPTQAPFSTLDRCTLIPQQYHTYRKTQYTVGLFQGMNTFGHIS